MSEGVQIKLKELQKSVEQNILGMHELNQLLKGEAMRILQLKCVFATKGDQKIVTKISKGQSLSQYDEYKELISKDLCDKIEGIIKSLKEVKKSMSILSTEIKTKKADKAENKIASFTTKIDRLFSQFGEIWTEGSYLICNYRLDIAAKEVNRWTQGLKLDVNEGDIRKQIQALFK